MSDTPHRPFVPKPSPPERAAPRPVGDFRIVRPFVHGQARSAQPEPAVAAEAKPVASIADFLAMDRPAPVTEFQSSPPAPPPPPIADYMATDNGYEAPTNSFEPPTYEAESEDELPPIEHFTDTIPEDDAPRVDSYAESLMDPFGATHEESQPDPHGWEETDWQRYDWRAAGALGEAGDPAASSAWAQTDWGKPANVKDSRDSAAKAIADALDGIARRIREGDLVIPPPPAAVPDPATIAATLAALLGVRR